MYVWTISDTPVSIAGLALDGALLKLLLRARDREPVMSSRTGAVGNDELPHQVVER
jgi:hypothetical protein